MGSVFDILYIVVAFLVVLSVHETSHALVAYYLGDSTAKLEGRITLNPVAHLDALGTVVLLMTQRIGWGKPVPINPRNFRHPVRDSALVALAGPVSNFILAFILAVPLHYIVGILPLFLVKILWITFNLSIYLGVFNLLPLPPLDGSKVLGLIVPKCWHYSYEKFLDDGMKYLVILLLVDWFVLEKFFSFSILGLFIDKGAMLVKLLILWGL